MTDWQYILFNAANIICIVGAALLAVFIIVVVLVQPGNSNGISALGGNADTFYNKGKGKTLESKLKKITFVCLGIMALLMIAFYVIQVFWGANL